MKLHSFTKQMLFIFTDLQSNIFSFCQPFLSNSVVTVQLTILSTPEIGIFIITLDSNISESTHQKLVISHLLIILRFLSKIVSHYVGSLAGF